MSEPGLRFYQVCASCDGDGVIKIGLNVPDPLVYALRIARLAIDECINLPKGTKPDVAYEAEKLIDQSLRFLGEDV